MGLAVGFTLIQQNQIIMKNKKQYMTATLFTNRMRAFLANRIPGVLELIILILLLFVHGISAQDIMTLKNGDEIEGKIIEISDQSIKYRRVKFNEDFIRIIPFDNVFMIKYENGLKEVLTHNNIAGERALENEADDDFAPGQAKYSGPRVGLTCITAGIMQDFLASKGKGSIITQFGWQFEKRLFGFADGPTGVFEFVPMLGGMEQGMFLPSVTTLVGLRGTGKEAVEFAMGPTLSRTGLAMAFALGVNLKSRKVNFPVTIAYVPSVKKQVTDYSSIGNPVTRNLDTGHRISILIGFNVRKA
jgi:hypothetical protein